MSVGFNEEAEEADIEQCESSVVVGDISFNVDKTSVGFAMEVF